MLFWMANILIQVLLHQLNFGQMWHRYHHSGMRNLD